MKLRAITMHGFKSFADRTRIEFHDGVTAVVGPNGCGKSNIADALRWVLGEQKPSVIRGSRMEETIFGGSSDRRPFQRAEVVLEIANEDGALQVPYAEVSIGRTVYRGGESEYALNGSPCRLRDIWDLVRDTGLGATVYALIEGRMVDAILSDKDEDRRQLFEEAAEVGRYKDRRRAALRKLEQTEADLRRIDDLLTELQGQVRSLAQQRGRAARHEEITSKLMRLQVALADHEIRESSQRAAAVTAELGAIRERTPDQATLDSEEARAESRRTALAEKRRALSGLAREAEEARLLVEETERRRLLTDEKLNRAREDLAGISARAEQARDDRRMLQVKLKAARTATEVGAEEFGGLAEVEENLSREAAAAAGALAAAETELEARRATAAAAAAEVVRARLEVEAVRGRGRTDAEDLENRRRSALQLAEEERLASAAAHNASGAFASAESDLSGLATEKKRLAEQLAGAEEALLAARQRRGRISGALSAARSAIDSLNALARSGELLPAAARLIRQAGDIPGIQGVLSDFVETEEEWAAAIELVLGPYLHGVVVEDDTAADRVRQRVADKGGDGVTILPGKPAIGSTSSRESAAGAPDTLQKYARASGPGAAWIEAILAEVTAAGSAGTPPNGPWANREGWYRDQLGAFFAGGPGSGGILETKARLTRLREEAANLETDLARAVAEAELAGGRAEAARTEFDDVNSRIAASDSALATARTQQESLGRRLEALRGDREVADARVRELEQREGSEEDRLRQAETAVATFEAAASAANTAEETAQEAAAVARANADATRAELHAHQVDRARKEEALVGLRAEKARLEQSLDDAERRQAEGRLEAERTENEVERLTEVAATTEEELRGCLEARSAKSKRAEAAREEVDNLGAEVEAAEGNIRQLRKDQRERAEIRHSLELDAARLGAAESAVRTRLEARWGKTLEQLRDQAGDPPGGTPREWSRVAEQAERSLARIGAVNLLAAERFEEARKRLEFQTSQREDLELASNELRDLIRRINRRAGEAFNTTFEEVRTHYKRTFNALFEGGRCELRLGESEDPLEAPIEISANPAGKRLERIDLLSGGERALTALALVFAVYLARPSPFCLMDEVDAPLDEVNVLRFVRLLEEFKDRTQFIVITHNPRTIENADWVYGVTMQEPGVSAVVGVELGSTASDPVN